MNQILTIDGDDLVVSTDPNGSGMWISPANGMQHPTWRDAMRMEIECYFESCGLDMADEKIVAEIDSHMNRTLLMR